MCRGENSRFILINGKMKVILARENSSVVAEPFRNYYFVAVTINAVFFPCDRDE